MIVVVVGVAVTLKWSFGDWKWFFHTRFFHTRKHVKEVKGAFSSKEQLKENRQNGQDEADPRFYRVSSSRHTVLFALSPGRST